MVAVRTMGVCVFCLVTPLPPEYLPPTTITRASGWSALRSQALAMEGGLCGPQGPVTL